MTALSEPIEIFAHRLLANPGREPAQRNVSLALSGGRITRLETESAVPEGPETLVMPALANAHDHGRGLRRLAYGALDDALEVWLAASSALHPSIDPYLVAVNAFARMARSGVTATVHCHMPQRFDRLMDEARAVSRAASDVGIRIAFVVPMVDRNRLAYGDDEAVLASLVPEDQDLMRARWLKPLPSPADQVALADEVAAAIGSETVDVQYGPFGLEWASDALLGAVADASAKTGRRIHMHCQETRIQRQWVDQVYPDGFLAHLNQLGVLTPRLTLAHCVHLRPAECDLLAERGVTIAINSSSNLRLGSGIAPVREMIKRGVRVAFGIDALSLDDDDDALRELRLAYRLHQATSLGDGLHPADLFRGAMSYAHEVVDDGVGHGEIATGAPADLLVLNYAALTEDAVSDRTAAVDFILGRATRHHVRSVIAGGREIVREGEILGVDLASAKRELIAQARAGVGESNAFLPALERYQAAVRSYYERQNYLG